MIYHRSVQVDAVCPDCHEKIKVRTAGSKTCTKCIGTPRTAKILLQRSSKTKKPSRMAPWMGFYAPNLHSSHDSAVYPFDMQPASCGEGASIALPSAVNYGVEESKLLSRIQKIAKNLPDGVPIMSSYSAWKSGPVRFFVHI